MMINNKEQALEFIRDAELYLKEMVNVKELLVAEVPQFDIHNDLHLKSCQLYEKRRYEPVGHFQDKKFMRCENLVIPIAKLESDLSRYHIAWHIFGILHKTMYCSYLIEDMGSHTNVFLDGLAYKDIKEIVITHKVRLSGQVTATDKFSLLTLFYFVYEDTNES